MRVYCVVRTVDLTSTKVIEQIVSSHVKWEDAKSAVRMRQQRDKAAGVPIRQLSIRSGWLS